MGTDRRVRGHPTRRLGPAVVLTALAAMLLAAPNALAGLYTVNSTLDTPGACTLSFCTLRQAVEAANLDPGSAITFQIGIGGSYTFLPATPLPDITQSVTIDATTQTGYAGAPLIQLDGSSAGSGAAGLRATGGSATIRGLAVVEFDGSGIAFSGSSTGNIVTGNYIGIGSGGSVARGNGTGIHVAASNTLIGGSGAARNVVSGNLFNGINIAGSSNTVRGNYVGLDASGNFAVPNLRGVVVSSDTNVIGGSDTARNVISGNTMQGVAIARASVNTVSENYIGTDATGVTAVPNGGAGVVIDGGDTGANTNTIGTNVISGNGGPGVLITTTSGGAGNNTVSANVIGTDWTGRKPIGNAGAGVSIAADSGIGNNTIGGLNTIAYNAKGIAAGTNTVRNTFSQNSIHDNTGPGIDLNDDGPTANDPGDDDTGANELLNYAVLSNPSRDATGHVKVDVSFDGALPSSQVDIELYRGPTCGAASSSVSTISTTSDGSGDVSFTGLDIGFVPANTFLSATTTDGLGDTSEFSPCLGVGAPLAGTTFTVTTSAVAGDSVCDAVCTLPEAIAAANAAPGTDTIAFNLPDPSIAIAPTETDPLPKITDDVAIDGTTQPGTPAPGTPVVRVDGALSPSNGPIGFDVIDDFGSTAIDGSTIRGLSITRFFSAGIELSGPPSVVEGNYIGLAPDGTAAGNGSGSGAGIVVDSDDNRVGGTTAGARNIISGNTGQGLEFGSNGFGNEVLGNRIGTSPDGTTPAPNSEDGIHFEDATAQFIGGTASGAGNLISGNGGSGIMVNSGFSFELATIEGNTIGLAADGTTPLPNQAAGVWFFTVDDAHLGGTAAGAGNVISGNLGEGVSVDLSDRAQVQGNLIGLDSSGAAAVPNGTSQLLLSSSDDTQIGGTTAGARNVIGGSASGNGILLDSGSNNNAIQGNYVGTDVTGEVAVGNADGINLSGGSAGNTIGGVVPGARNVISGSNGPGVRLDDAGTGNRVLGNSIGTDKDETDVIPNDIGIELDGTAGTQIGTNSPGAGNVIGGHPDAGILIFVGSSSNIVAGNYIGTNRSGSLALGNDDGMRIVNGLNDNNLIGPDNVIAHNTGEGIEIDSGTGNRVSANSIHDNGGKGIVVAPGANNDPEAPAISAAKIGAQTNITGTLHSGANTSYFVEYFLTPTCTGAPQGQFYVGFQTVFTDEGGTAPLSFSSSVPAAGQAITATATSVFNDTSEFSTCATVSLAGLLQGSIVPSSDPPSTLAVDLTAAGGEDWAVWGFAAGGTSTSLSPDVRKAGGASISDLQNVDPAPSISLRGIGQFTEPLNFSWSDGSGPLSATNAQVGIQHDGQAAAVSSVGHGFAFDVPANTATRKLSVYVETNRAQGQLTATLSDGSAPAYVDFVPPGADRRTGVYTIDYAAASAGQTLHVEWVESQDFCPTFHCDNAALHAVALSAPLYVVNANDDVDDGSCNASHCSLHEAIAAANASGGLDTIEFNIPGGGPSTITPTSALPIVTDPISIDGTTQPGVPAGTKGIAVNGAAAGSADGLFLGAGSGGSTIRGLAIHSFKQANKAGIRINSNGNVIAGNYVGTGPDGAGSQGNTEGVVIENADNNRVGGITAADRNVLSGNDDAGVLIDGTGTGATGNSVRGNYIGLDASGQTRTENLGPGVWVLNATNTKIGGAFPADGNVISGNFNEVMLGDFTSPSTGSDTSVRNNLIGLTADGTVAAGFGAYNGVEVMDAGSNTIVDNTIGSEYQGVDICGSSNNTVIRNVIGSDPGLASDFGASNQGISIFGGPCPFTAPATNNIIGGTSGDGNTVLNSSLNGVAADSASNTISHNTVRGTKNGPAVEVNGNSNTIGPGNTINGNARAGVRVNGGNGNTITQNSLDANGGLGIDLRDPADPPSGVTPNDSGDVDAGANGLQNFPVITNALNVGTGTKIDARLDTIPGNYQIEFFSSSSCDPSGNGEGKTFLGTGPISFAVPNQTFTITHGAPLPAGTILTMTATSPLGDTSEFSACATVQPGILATNLSIAPTPASTTAGAARVKLSDVPPSVLLAPQSTSQTAPVNETPVNETPVNELPVNELPVNEVPVNELGFDSLSATIPALGNISLASVPLLRTGGWPTALSGTPLATVPLQNVTFRDYYALPVGVNPETRTSPPPIAPITLGDLDLSRSPLGSLPSDAIVLANVQLSWLRDLDVWCRLFGTVYCTNGATGLSNTTVMAAALQGAPVNETPVNETPVNETPVNEIPVNEVPVNETPVNEVPVNELPVNETPVNELPVNETPVNELPVNEILLTSPVNEITVNELPVNEIMARNATLANSPVNEIPVNELATPNTIVVCASTLPAPSGTVDCATATLGQAYARGALRPGITLGDLVQADGAAPDALDGITLGDLHYFGDVTLRGLIDSYPDGTFTLGDYFLLVLRSPTASQGLGWENLNVANSDIQQYSTGGSTVGYRAQFNVQASGAPPGFASPVTVDATLADGFFYVPGSSKLVSSATSCATAAPAIADPTETTLNDGRLKLTYTVDTVVGNGYAICLTARPGIELGPQAASLDATPDGGVAAAANGTTLNVLDTLEPNSDPATAPQLFSDSFYLSYLTSATDVDYYRFAAPPVGTVVTIHVSHLPADFDLVAYGPPGTQLRPSLATTPPLDTPPVTDGGFDLTHQTDTLSSQTLDDLRLRTDLPMVGVSASRNTDPEDIVFVSQGGSDFYTIQITGYNGATSDAPYMLRVQTQPPRQTANVSPRTITGTAGPALPALPSGLNTVFVVNRRQLEGLHGSAGASSVMSALSSDSALFTSLGYPNVTLSVENYAAVQTAYDTWNSNPGSPAAANGVVAAINGVIDSQIRSRPNGAGVKYLVLVGGDQVVPMARLDDFTVSSGNEAGFAANFPSTSDLFSSLSAGQFLSDDPYGDTNPVPYLTRQLYIPEIAVGRLVETPADIVRTLNNFVSTAVGGKLDPTSSLTTGYDFLNDGAQDVNTAFARFGNNARTLFDDPSVSTDGWTLQNLLDSFLPPTAPAPSITSLNGHASHFQFAPPNLPTGSRSPLFTTSTLMNSNTSLANRLIFSMGCHAGLSVADSILIAGNLDWPQAYAQKSSGGYLGNTGFGFGDSLVVAYSEELSKLFAQRIAAGSSVGEALAAAKQAYYAELGVFGVYDEKAMAEFTLYGLPMWKVTGPPAADGAGTQAFAASQASTADTQSADTTSAAPAVPDTAAAPLGVVTDPATGLDAETFDVNPANTQHTTGQGDFWSGLDGVQVTHLRPIQPKAFVGLGGTTGHGALITELTSGDLDCINPVYARPVIDLTGTEPEIPFGDVAFPSKLQSLRTFVTPSGLQQRLVLVTGQFFSHTCSTNSDPQVGVQRLFSHVAGKVYRSTSTDFIPPAYQLIRSTAVGSNAAFTVDVTDTTPSTDAVKQVVVAVRSGTQTAWTFVNLTQSASSLARWTGGAPVSDVDHYEYFVQAVDKNGNVAVSTNKGFYFAGDVVQQPTGTLQASLIGTKTNDWFTSAPVGVSASEAPGVTLQASVDGEPFGNVPTSISGDGVHTIDFRASNGDTGTLIAPIDTLGPATTLNAPVQGAQYVRGSTVKADYFCRDSGSGLLSGCVGTVANGANIDTSCATATCTKNFVITAPKDVAGHTGSAVSITYTVVVRRKILFSSARTTSGDIYAMNADGTGVVQLTSTPGLDEQPAWSPDGSHIAFASARSGSNGLDIYVMNADGSSVRRLTTAAGDDTVPAWSPDGNKIAFQSLRDGNIEIYSMNNDGTGQTRLTNVSNQDLQPSWSPDGRKIAFASNRNGGPNIWVMDANGANPRQLTSTTQPEGYPVWSPDGTKIVFNSKRKATNGNGSAADIYTMTPTGGNITQLTTMKGDDTEPVWSQDGLFIAFTSVRDGNQNVFSMTASGGSQTRLTTYTGFDGNPSW